MAAQRPAAAEGSAEKFLDNPIVKGIGGFAMTLLAALILYVCSTITDGLQTLGAKLDGVLISLGNFSKEMALTQHDVKQIAELQRVTGNKVEKLEQESIRLTMRVEQLEKGRGNEL